MKADKPQRLDTPEGAVPIYCSTNMGIRKCRKFLGYTFLCLEWKYCKSCKQMNYYEIFTKTGIDKAKRL